MPNDRLLRTARRLVAAIAAALALGLALAGPGFASSSSPLEHGKRAAVSAVLPAGAGHRAPAPRTARPDCVVLNPGGGCYVPPACTGTGCWGLDPVATGCDKDGETVGQYQSSFGLLELRYSPSCESNWALLVNHPLGVPCQFFVENAANQGEGWALTPDPGRDGTSGWTNMVSGIPLAYAEIEGSDGSGYGWTGWH